MFKSKCINKLATLSTSETIKTAIKNHPNHHILATMDASFPGFIDPEPALNRHQNQIITSILFMPARETVQGSQHKRSQLKCGDRKTTTDNLFLGEVLLMEW